MAKINLDNVRGIDTFSVVASEAHENGELVGLGNLLEGEPLLYEEGTLSADNFYLVTTVELDRESKDSGLDKTNKEGEHMRVHQLEKGDIFTVEQSVAQNVNPTKGQAVSVDSSGFVNTADEATDSVGVVIEAGTIGFDARPSVTIRMTK